MSEISLPALVEKSKELELKAPTPMEDVNAALKTFGFGWFHVQLMFTSFFGLFAGVLITNITPYILPSAECDLDMNLFQKGILTGIPYVGMIASSAVAGFLSDTFGRKIFLVGGYAMMAVFNLISGFSQTYAVLVTSKFFEGLVFAVAFSPAMTFTSEFCHNGIRDRVMLIQSSFVSTSLTIIAGITWAMLINDWRYSLFGGFLVLNTWNFYIIALTTFSVVACILYSFLPESPKYLISQHRYDEARKTLLFIYRRNTRKPADTFPYANLWKDQIKQAIDEAPEHKKPSLSKQLTEGLHNVKPLFMKPHVHFLLLFCFMNFIIMCLYNVIRMWYPQLSTIVEHYSPKHNELCDMLDSYTHDLRIRKLNTTVSEVCVPTRSGAETYINSLIMSSICVPPYLIMSLIVNKVGKKRLLVTGGLISVACCLGLRWSNSKPLVVALFSVDICVGQIMMSMLQATSVELFPTSIRTLAISLLMTSGRIGSLLGNIMFPILLDMGCVVPFYTLAGLMTVVTIMAICVPSKKN